MRSKLLTVLVLCCLAAVPTVAQDLGPAADTVALVVTRSPSANAGTDTLELQLWVYNDDLVKNANMGFNWDNPNLQMIEAESTPLVDDAFDLIVSFFEDGSLALTNTNQRFLFGGARLFNGMAGGTERRHWATYKLAVSSWTVNDSIVLDTTEWNNGTIWVFVNANTDGYQPVWLAGNQPLVIYDPDRPAASNMVVAPGVINVEAQAGSGVQPDESFNVSSDGDPLTLSVGESADWLSVSPTGGTTPQDFAVTVDVGSLSPGPYSEDVTITSPEASNSPQTVTVNLTVTEPPPTIAVDQASLAFSGVEGGGNPAPQALNISNTGGGTLDPTVSTGTGWLAVVPTSGTAPFAVSVSATVGSLTAGTYEDTVTITDPDATNNPFKVPVTFTIEANEAPVITPVNDTTITECDSLTLMFSATDADGNDVEFSLAPLASNMDFVNLVGNTARLRFDPSFDQAGTYPLTLTATDGIASVDFAFTITVEDCDPGYDAVIEVNPDPLYIFMNRALEPVVGTVILGDFTDGVHTVDDIDQSSVRLDGSIVPFEVNILDSYPGFTGKVAELKYYVGQFILPRIPTFNTVQVSFAVEGSFNDAAPFLTARDITFVGKFRGDFNGDGTFDIVDLSAMVEFLFNGGPPPTNYSMADFDFSGEFDPVDLTIMVDYFFGN